MKLLRLAVGQLGAVVRAEITPGPGLCVLHGPNDLGKSTLAQAIRMALLLPATSRAADPWRSWHGGGAPTVEATFELGPQQIVRISKEFAGTRGAARYESSRDGRTFHEEHAGRAVDGELRRVLRWGIPEPGGAGGQHGLPASYLATTLLGPQDAVAGVLDADLDDDRDTTGRDRVADALQALARDPRFVGVLAETQARYDEVWTATGNLRRAGRLKDVSEDVQRAERAVAAQQALVDGTEVVRTELGRDGHSGARGDAARARLAAADARGALAELERRAAAGAAVDAAAAVVAGHARADAELAAARAELAVREVAERAAAGALVAARAELAAARDRQRAAAATSDHDSEAAVRQQLAELGRADADLGRDLLRAQADVGAAVRRDDARRHADAARAAHDAAVGAREQAARAAHDASAGLAAWDALRARLAAEDGLARVDAAERELTEARAADAAHTTAHRAAEAALTDARAALARADAEARRAAADGVQGDDGRAEHTLAAERAAAHVDALRRAHARRSAAASALRAAAAAATTAEAASGDAARTDLAAETARAALADWETVEAALDALDRRAAAELARERRAARARAVAEHADAVERVAAVEARRAKLVAPDRAALAALRALQAELDGARSALSVGITLQIAPRVPIKLTLRADGAPGMSLTASSPIDLEARASAILELADAVITVTGGGREALDRVTALEARAAAELAPALAAAGASDVAGLDAAADRAQELDRELGSARVAVDAAARALDALPALAEPDVSDVAIDPRAEALGEADPRGAWRKRRDTLARAADAAGAAAADARTRAAVAAATARSSEAPEAAAVLAEPEVDPLAPAEAAAALALAALAALDRGVAERRAAAEASAARATAALDEARDAEQTALRALAAAGVEAGRRGGRVATATAALDALAPAEVRARAAALAPAPAGWSGRPTWERELAVRRAVDAQASDALRRADTDLAVAAQARARAEEAAAASEPAPPTAEAQAGLAEVAARSGAARAALAQAQAHAEAGRGERSRARELADAALGVAEAGERAADAAANDATAALGRARGRVDTLAAALPAGERAAATQRLADVRAAAGDLPTADARARAELRAAQAQAALEVAEATFQRLQGALDHVGGTVAEERLAEAKVALALARAHELEVQVESDAWKLLRDVLLAAERDQAANLGGALGPLLGDRLRELAGPRYEGVLLAPHLRAEGVVVGGESRATGALSVGTRDQLATLVRLCLAERLGTMLVLDDQLVHTDDVRLDWFRRALLEVGRTVQVLVFTCRPGDYPPPGDGVTHVDLGAAITRAG